MIEHVNGKNVILTADNGVEYVPFACIQTISFLKTRGIIPTATPDSSTDETFAYDGLSQTSITMGAVTFLRDLATGRYFVFDLLGAAGNSGLNIRIVFTDIGGYSRSINCSVLFPSVNIDSTVSGGQLSKWLTTMQVTGPLTYNAAPPVVGSNDVLSAAFAITAGQSFVIPIYPVTGLALIGKSIIEVWRSGLQHDPVTTAPGNREYKYTTATGRFDFDSGNPFNAGETVFVVWQN